MNEEKQARKASELSELLACPFCGGKARVLTLKHQDKKHYKVFCTKCNVRQYRKRKKYRAIEAWNQRIS